MAGYTQGAVENLLTSSVTATAGAETLVKDDVDLTGCWYAWAMATVTTNASATDGIEFRWYKKTGSGGTKADDYCYPKGVDEGVTNHNADLGTIEPGIYALYVKNNDSSYDATVSQVMVNKFTT